MVQLAQDEKAQVKVITAGDEIALEQKINAFLSEMADQQVLADLKINQIEYHSRTGTTDFALMAVIVLRVKK
jgi:hypothetical protein